MAQQPDGLAEAPNRLLHHSIVEAQRLITGMPAPCELEVQVAVEQPRQCRMYRFVSDARPVVPILSLPRLREGSVQLAVEVDAPEEVASVQALGKSTTLRSTKMMLSP